MEKSIKKILILGANIETVPLVQTARNMGLCVIVTDNNPAAPAKKYADISINIDGMDINSIVNFCQKEKVDSVLVGVADRLVRTYQETCNILNIPHYINKNQASILSNKKNFDNYCSIYNLDTIPKINIQDINSNILQKGIFLKPVDGCSGKGLNIAHSTEELNRYYKLSLEHSITKDILLEQCMIGDEIFAYFTIIDGEIYLSAVADKITTKSQGITGKIILNSIYPSKYTELFYNTQFNKITELLKSLKIKTGIFMISAFVEDEKFYLYDPGCRLQGEGPDVVIDNLFGIDHKKMLISFALNERYDISQKIINTYNQFIDFNAATVWILAKEGKIKEITGLDNIVNKFGVYNVLQRLYPGDTITSNMIKTEAQVIARIYTKAPNSYLLNKNIQSIRDQIKVLSSNNEDLLIYE